ncbi:histidine phosphatase family protein [Demequina zhanjiangensis]|uniref:Histidine phosphatase family protein n=1 Tax=Demequina zhanjiangensis TaxID=3051659 RepID=A0ABT8G075_9MICO|nr:histidine phosphatase family protein [Demequina sp. SYSU T00b26]MDN4472417.1 histidine phosphatase family protein [Demequina sp. SYSU T00b26]
MTTLILLRHGRTDYNADGRLQGSLDVPLGDEGRSQARAAARHLHASYGAPDALLSSPLLRAFDTARELGVVSGVEPLADERLTQRSYGAWEGRTWDEVRERWPEQYAVRMRGEDPDIEGWGRSGDVGARVADCLQEACRGRSLVTVVSHGSALMLGALTLLGLPPLSTSLGKLPHGHWNVMTRSSTGAWSMERYAIDPSGARLPRGRESQDVD